MCIVYGSYLPRPAFVFSPFDVVLEEGDNDNENILFDHNIQIYITDL